MRLLLLIDYTSLQTLRATRKLTTNGFLMTPWTSRSSLQLLPGCLVRSIFSCRRGCGVR